MAFFQCSSPLGVEAEQQKSDMMKMLKAFVLIGMMLGLPKAFAQDASQDTVAIPLNPAIIHKTLPNGFSYYIQKNALPKDQIQFRMVIKAGSILETEQQRGFAHFLEHMAFNGSKHFPENQLVDYLQSIGVEFGSDLNAYTGYDETVYMLPLPNSKKETLDNGFYMLGDILNGLNLTTEDIDKERSIIHEEWRTTIGLSQRLKDAMYPLLYQGSRYLDRRPIGLMSVVMGKGNEEGIRQFYKDWYRPDLATLVVVGDLNPAEIEKRIIATFGPMTNPSPEKERKYYGVPDHDNTLVKIIQDKEITSTSIKVIHKYPKHEEKTLKDLRRSVVNLLYTYMVNQRLSDVAQSPNAPYMYAQSYSTSASGNKNRYISLATVKADKIIDGTKGLMRELQRIKQYGFTQAELDRKKEILRKDFESMALEENKQTSAQLTALITNHVISGEECSTLSFKKKFVDECLKTISLSDVQSLVEEFMHGEQANRVVLLTAPASATTPSKADLLTALDQVQKEKVTPFKDTVVDAPLMTTTPKGGKIAKEVYDKDLDVTHLTFANGVTVDLKPTEFKNNEIRFTSVRNGGYSKAAADNFDNASMAATFTNLGGLSNFSSMQLDRILSAKQVYLAPYIHRYTEGVSGFSSKEDFETLMKLTYLTYTAPRKDPAKFKQFIDNKKEYNRNSLNDPDSYFADQINKEMSQHDPRTETLLTPEQLDRLSLDKSFDFYKSRFNSAKGAHFIIVGSFDVNTIKPLLTTYLGGLPAGPVDASFNDEGIRPPKKGMSFDYPRNTVDKSKVVIRYTGDFPASQKDRVEMGLLGDILTIRLNQKLREEIGGVYSPYAAANVFKYPYTHYRMDIFFTCASANRDALVNAAVGQIKEMQKGISATNLDKVKKAALKDRKASLQMNGYWRKLLEDQWSRGESKVNFEQYNKDIQSVTAKDLQKMARKYLKANKHLEFTLSPNPEAIKK